MTDINAVGGLASTTTLREFANQASRRTSPSGAVVLADRVEISELADFLNRLAELPEERARRIVEVRSAIASGTYETAEKLDYATERLMKEF